MTRRMKGNEEFHAKHAHRTPNVEICNRHCREHDESLACDSMPTCQPATVAVPVTGTVLVVDGVVQEVVAATKTATDFSDLYTLSVRKPKPSFFEPHKTYRRSASDYQAHRFDCVRIDRDSSGNLIAYGQLYYPTWTTWNTLSYFDDTWKEEA